MNTAVLVAAGSSRRMGFDKLLADLAGRPVLVRSLEAFAAAASVDALVVVASGRAAEAVEAWRSVSAPAKPLSIVPGGAERHLSVLNGLRAVPAGTTHVAVHDAARPLVAPSAIEETLACARQHGAAVLARPITDTVKRASPGDDPQVTENVDRDGLWAMETPQVARLDWLLAALDAVVASGGGVTDEVSALQQAGRPVRIVRSRLPNLKITWPEDIDLAARLLGTGP